MLETRGGGVRIDGRKRPDALSFGVDVFACDKDLYALGTHQTALASPRFRHNAYMDAGAPTA